MGWVAVASTAGLNKYQCTAYFPLLGSELRRRKDGHALLEIVPHAEAVQVLQAGTLELASGVRELGVKWPCI